MKNKKTIKQNSYIKHYTNKLLLILASFFILLGVANAGTISDSSGVLTYDSVNICMADGSTQFTGNVNFGGNELLGIQNIELNGTNLYLYSDSDITVCPSGCDYTTIQSAIDDTPKKMYATKRIHVSDGIYNEDIYISDFDCVRSTGNEGSIVCLRILGNSSNINGVKINSFQIAGTKGANAVEIQDLQINGIEPLSDENTSVSVYGSQLSIRNINFTGIVDYGLVSYGSSVQLTNSNFNGNQKHVGQAKSAGSVLRLGDFYNDGKLTGSVKEELVKSDDGAYIFIENNNVSYVGNISKDKGYGIIIETAGGVNADVSYYNLDVIPQSLRLGGDLDMNTNKITDIGKSGTDFTDDGSLSIVNEASSEYSLNIRNLDVITGRHLRIKNSAGSDLFLITDSKFNMFNNIDLNDYPLSEVGQIQSGDLEGTYTGGSAYVCVYDSGVIYASETACP